MTEKCRMQREEMKQLSSFRAERRQYENRISKLDAEIEDLRGQLGSSENTAVEKESAIVEFRHKLTGVTRTKDMINSCLNEASGSIKTALSLTVSDGHWNTHEKQTLGRLHALVG